MKSTTKCPPFFSTRALSFLMILILCMTMVSTEALAKRRKKRFRYNRPHPVVLWAKAIRESYDLNQRQVAAFKLSQYSQPIYHSKVIETLLECMKDNDTHIRVLCTKALSKVNRKNVHQKITTSLLEQYKADPGMRNRIVRTFIKRKEDSREVSEVLLSSLKVSKNDSHLVQVLAYFEHLGNAESEIVPVASEIYQKNKSESVKLASAKVLLEKGKGGERTIEILSDCATSDNTPLQLTCLSGLQTQARGSERAWQALARAIESDDPDVLLATLDTIDTFPEYPHPQISKRLLRIALSGEDSELREKAILGLGVTGDKSPEILSELKKMIQSEEDEGIQVATALVLGKQGIGSDVATFKLLEDCKTSGNSQAIKTACGLGAQEIRLQNSRTAASEPTVKAVP